MRRHGLPPVEFHARIGRYTVDFLVVDTPVVVECDGWAAHVLDRSNWERQPAATAARISRTVDRWKPPVLGQVSSGFRN